MHGIIMTMFVLCVSVVVCHNSSGSFSMLSCIAYGVMFHSWSQQSDVTISAHATLVGSLHLSHYSWVTFDYLLVQHFIITWVSSTLNTFLYDIIDSYNLSSSTSFAMYIFWFFWQNHLFLGYPFTMAFCLLFSFPCSPFLSLLSLAPRCRPS